MASKATIERNNRIFKNASKKSVVDFRAKIKEQIRLLKHQFAQRLIKNNYEYDEKCYTIQQEVIRLQLELGDIPVSHNKFRYVKRCYISGRGTGVIGAFGCSRNMVFRYISKIAGVRKHSKYHK